MTAALNPRDAAREWIGPTMSHHPIDNSMLPGFLKPFGVIWGSWAVIGNIITDTPWLAIISAVGPILIGIAALWNAATNARKARQGK